MKKLRWFEKFTASDFDLLIDAVKYTLADTEPATEDVGGPNGVSTVTQA